MQMFMAFRWVDTQMQIITLPKQAAEDVSTDADVSTSTCTKYMYVANVHWQTKTRG